MINAISPEEVQAFLAKYHLTQREASQITGLGEKNISRWMTGRSRPLESVSNFLRLLLADEAAFKDTGRKSNSISGGLWVWLGEQAAAEVHTAPFGRDKLRKAVKDLRELTQHPLESVAPQVKEILCQAGVALVFVPAMKETALRGCTRLLTPSRAMIIHSLKYRNLSQFWIILFHEIAHLLLHIEAPGDTFTDYEEQSTDPREVDADTWAYDALVSLDDELEFKAKSPVPAPWQVEQFARRIRVHPAIVAEVFNKRAGNEVISYSLMRMKGFFPTVDASVASKLMALSRVVAAG